MSRGRATFRKSDLTRAMRAARDAGLLARYEIDPETGKISIEILKSSATEQVNDEQERGNPWDTI